MTRAHVFVAGTSGVDLYTVCRDVENMCISLRICLTGCSATIFNDQ